MTTISKQSTISPREFQLLTAEGLSPRLPFPKRLTIELADFQRDALEEIANREPHDGASDLLAVVISRGILAMLAENDEAPVSPQEIAGNLSALKERLHSLQSTTEDAELERLEAKYATRPYPAPSVMFQRRRERLEGGADHAADANSARSTISSDRNEPHEREPAPHRHAERYLATPVSEHLRQRFEDFLNSHPDLSEEEALTILLQRALAEEGQVDTAVPSLSERKATRMLNLAGQLYAKAKRRCGA